MVEIFEKIARNSNLALNSLISNIDLNQIIRIRKYTAIILVFQLCKFS